MKKLEEEIEWEREFDKKFGLGDVVSKTDMGEEFDGFRYDDALKQFIKQTLKTHQKKIFKIINEYCHPKVASDLKYKIGKL